MCGLTFWFRAVVVLWFNFFCLLRLSFILRSMSAMRNSNQLMIKTKTIVSELRNLTRRLFHILGNSSTHIEYISNVYDKPDIFCNNFSATLTVRKKNLHFENIFQCVIISWRRSAVHKKWPKQQQIWTN